MNGILWSALERFSTQGIQFVIGLVLARLLSPSDYGMVGMLAIFIALSQTFVDGGFSLALIQKNNCTENDFSTVFYFNIIIGVVIYGILFISAPYIERFYDLPGLASLTKVLGLGIIISSFSLIHRTILTIVVDFKTQANISLIATLVGGTVSVLLAYNGFGVWSLVVQSLLIATINTVLLWFFSRWTPLILFSKKSFKSLFSFGSKMLATSILNTFFKNIILVVIGKAFSVQELGYYSRAEQFQRFSSENISQIIQRVAFPIMSSVKSDSERLYRATRQYIGLSMFFVLPLMAGLMILSEPLIRLLLTEKWLPAVPLLRLLCFTGMLYPIHSININLIIVKGMSSLVFKLELIKRSLMIIAIILTLPYGIKAMIIGQIVISFISLFINTYYSGKLINYNSWQQIKDIIPTLVNTIIMSSIVMAFTQIFDSDIIKLCFGALISIALYFCVAWLFKIEELNKLKELICQK